MVSDQTGWTLALFTLPARQASTARVRLWRALKDLGAGSPRDGVAVLPASDAAKAAFDTLAAEVAAAGGTAWRLELPAQASEAQRALVSLFDRSADYAVLSKGLAALWEAIPGLDEVGARRRLRQMDKTLSEIERLDFFPGAPRKEALAARQALAAEVNRRFSPAEPTGSAKVMAHLDRRDYQGRTWATRRQLWVDRVASAWLIRRHIDPKAHFVWLASPGDCPPEALGFDFDGATFSHVGERVTFEVLLASFGLDEQPGLKRLAALIRYLDIGGPPVPEAPGFEAVLAGLRANCANDDALLAAATPVLDALQRRFADNHPDSAP